MKKMLLVLALLVILGISGCENGSSQSTASSDSMSSQTCREEQVAYQDTEEYTEQEPYDAQECNNIEIPYTTTEQREETLFDEKDKAISPSDRLYVAVNLPADATVEVYFKADDTLNAWAMSTEEFNKVISDSGYSVDQYYMKTTDVTESLSTFKTVGADAYVIYLKNAHVFETVSVYEFKAVATWDEQVSATKTQQVCNTVTKYQEVTKTRPVTKYKTETVCD